MRARYVLLAATLLADTAGGAVLAQQTATYDPTQLPAIRGKVTEYSLTPRGDVDGLILEDGTEVHLPPHLGVQLVFAVKPGDQVTVHGLKARSIAMVQAISVTNDATGSTVTDNGPNGARGPREPGQPLSAQGRIKAQLHGPPFVRKTIYSLMDLREILLGCNRRYLEYLSSLDDFSAGIRALDRLTQPRPVKGRNLKGLNFFNRVEQSLLAALQRPGFNIAGLRRADLRPLLTQCSPATLSRQLARLRQLGVIKRVTGTYRYYLTRAGRAAIAAGRRLTEQTIIPALA